MTTVATERLVEVRRGVTGGVFVRHPGLGQVSEVISLLFATRSTTIAEWVEFRLLLEPTAAELAARRAMTRHLTGYRDYMEQQGLMSAPLINLDER
ncbi:hypothetical protein HJ590_03275 [Naumannella sp. ID2617S]|nr:hypothetical protein [Naumannella sp. ID2617S]